MQLSNSFCRFTLIFFLQPLNLQFQSEPFLTDQSVCQRRRQLSLPAFEECRLSFGQPSHFASSAVIPAPTCRLIMLITVSGKPIDFAICAPTIAWSTVWFFERPRSCKSAPASTSSMLIFSPLASEFVCGFHS